MKTEKELLADKLAKDRAAFAATGGEVEQLEPNQRSTEVGGEEMRLHWNRSAALGGIDK